MNKTVHGRIRGTTIELEEDLGVPDGQEVEVQVRVLETREREIESRRLGTMKGSVTYMAADFDAPLNEFKEYMP